MPHEFEKMLEGFAAVVGAGSVTSDTFQEAADEVHAIIASARPRYDDAFMESVPNLKVIARTGIGIDNISLTAATARGVAVCNTPDVPSVSTAEHAIALMFAVTKHLKHVEAALQKGERRNFFSEHRGIELKGAHLGVVGIGRIGSNVATYAQGFGMVVTGYDPFAPAERFAELGIERAPTLEALLREADVVSLHLPSTPETHHLINADRLAQMKAGSYLINTARGNLVDEAALADALDRKHLHGAGLDVFDPEPPHVDNPLLHREDVVATPHVAGITVASRQRFWQEAITQSLQVLRGERPPNLVNLDVWPRLSQP